MDSIFKKITRQRLVALILLMNFVIVFFLAVWGGSLSAVGKNGNLKKEVIRDYFKDFDLLSHKGINPIDSSNLIYPCISVKKSSESIVLVKWPGPYYSFRYNIRLVGNDFFFIQKHVEPKGFGEAWLDIVFSLNGKIVQFRFEGWETNPNEWRLYSVRGIVYNENVIFDYHFNYIYDKRQEIPIGFFIPDEEDLELLFIYKYLKKNGKLHRVLTDGHRKTTFTQAPNSHKEIENIQLSPFWLCWDAGTLIDWDE